MRTRVRTEIRDGAKAAWPICLGYVPIGLAFGVLAQKAGLGPWKVALMSALVFAGSSQFIAVAMLQAGAGIGPIVATTFVVNVRHALMSSSLAVPLTGAGRWFLALFAYGITDESFALNMSRFRQAGWDRWRALTLNHAANLAWIASAVAGAHAGHLIPPRAFGIDYALIAMFLCLLVLQLRSRAHALTALLSGAVALALYLTLPGNGYVVLGAVVGATAGLALRRLASAKKGLS
ncbi:MAG: AzlC family ABC transporter permease [Deferrisomatales bacterium]|nr:AzlC family ABC transporter permease [Deferrisomatales bacterium]